MTRMVAIFTLTIGLSALDASISSVRAEPQHAATGASPVVASGVPTPVVGRWNAPPERVPLSEGNAWGRNATSLRLAELRIGTDGMGTLTVTRSVVNRAGAPFPGSRIVERVEFALGEEMRPSGRPARYTTTIKNTSRRYLDPPVVQSTIEGLQLEIFPPDEAEPNTLQVDFQEFAGDGSFSARLQRQRTATEAS